MLWPQETVSMGHKLLSQSCNSEILTVKDILNLPSILNLLIKSHHGNLLV